MAETCIHESVTRIEILLALSALLFAAGANAQDRDRVEVFGGYSYVNSDFTSTVSNGVSGWDVSAAVNVVRYAGIVADLSGFYPTGPNTCHCGAPSASYHTFLGGPHASISIGRIKPFANFLVGATRGSFTYADYQSGSDFSYFTYGAGGGIDIGLDRWLAVRGQVDWLHVGSQAPRNLARVSTGLVFRF